MPVKRKKPAVSKEELERIAREQEERQRQEDILRKELEAEARQDKENERRDFEDEEERKRMKKEEQIRLMALKDARIVALSTELESQKMLFAAERTELETELERMLQLRESLLNNLSTLRAETDETQRRLFEDRARILDEHNRLCKEHSNIKVVFEKNQEDAANAHRMLTEKHESVSRELIDLTNVKENNERVMIMKIKDLEREVEKLSALNTTLQDVIESREADDRKNVTLMQLLNNQLDESKRKSQEILDEERDVSSKVKAQNVLLEAKMQQLQEEKDLLRREKESLLRQAESNLHDYQSKIEQLKFDMKYLHSELHSFKNQCHKQQAEVTQIKSTASADVQNSKLEQETLSKRVEELEALLRRKDREQFDKSTFLNAQIANNRTIIAQLQQKLKQEREERQIDSNAAHNEITNREGTLKLMASELEKKKLIAGDIEMKLSSDNSILKATVYQLQSALVEREKETDTIVAAKDEEITRLRRKLDENFIPHKHEIAATAGQGSNSEGKPLEVALGEKVTKLARELEIRNKTAQEVEVRLKAQLSNQGLIIDSLQVEMAKYKSDAEEREKLLEAENTHLKRTLEINCIPYKN